MRKKKVGRRHVCAFKQAGMTLWCGCGASRDIVCAHKWALKKEDRISFAVSGRMVVQIQQTRICDACGAIAAVNTTTGEIVIKH